MMELSKHVEFEIKQVSEQTGRKKRKWKFLFYSFQAEWWSHGLVNVVIMIWINSHGLIQKCSIITQSCSWEKGECLSGRYLSTVGRYLSTVGLIFDVNCELKKNICNKSLCLFFPKKDYLLKRHFFKSVYLVARIFRTSYHLFLVTILWWKCYYP